MHSQDIFLVLFNKTVRRHTIQYNPYLLSIVLAFLVTQLLEVFSPNLMVKVSTILLSASPMEKRKKKKKNYAILKSRLSRSWSKSPSEELRARLPKMWTCMFLSCVFSAISLRILFTHLNLVHSDDEFQVTCGLGDSPGCQKVFLKYNSFYKHVRRKHDDVNKGHTLPPVHGNYFIVPTEQGNEDSLQHSADLTVEEADESGELATVHETGIDLNELDDQMKSNSVPGRGGGGGACCSNDLQVRLLVVVF